MAKFKLTRHFIQRAQQRRLPIALWTLRLTRASKSVRRRIADSCSNEGINRSCVYFLAKVDGMRVIYVCKKVKSCTYVVLTAFDLNERL